MQNVRILQPQIFMSSETLKKLENYEAISSHEVQPPIDPVLEERLEKGLDLLDSVLDAVQSGNLVVSMALSSSMQ